VRRPVAQYPGNPAATRRKSVRHCTGSPCVVRFPGMANSTVPRRRGRRRCSSTDRWRPPARRPDVRGRPVAPVVMPACGRPTRRAVPNGSAMGRELARSSCGLRFAASADLRLGFPAVRLSCAPNCGVTTVSDLAEHTRSLPSATLRLCLRAVRRRLSNAGPRPGTACQTLPYPAAQGPLRGRSDPGATARNHFLSRVRTRCTSAIGPSARWLRPLATTDLAPGR